jgi:hypothetical protein
MREAVPPLPQCVFMAWCLVKHRDNFTFIVVIYFSFHIREDVFLCPEDSLTLRLTPDFTLELRPGRLCDSALYEWL